MAAVARALGGDSVMSPDGTGNKCRAPMRTSTDQGNGNSVFVNGILAVNIGCQVAPHPRSGCSNDSSTLSTASSTVFVGGRGIARIGDNYGNNVITSGSQNVFSG